jgi:serine-type D-Ala-D-Ala endopeptidase (penicillin-binding protein 7)
MKKKIIVAAVAVLMITALPVVFNTPVFVASSADAASPSTFPRAPRAITLPSRQVSYAQPTLRKAVSIVPQKIVAPNGLESIGVKTTANKVFVADLMSGEELYSQNPDAPTPIASITKLMTALVILDNHPNWNAKVTMDNPVDGGGLPFFAPGDTVTVRDLWQTMLIGSSNSAATALAASTGLSSVDFVSEMNAKAAGLNLANTKFNEPTGLSAQNISTARDVSLLLKAAIQKRDISDAMLASSFVLKKISGKTVRIASTDKLLNSFVNKKPYKILGAKTGFIDESGHNIAVSFSKDGAGSVVIVVIGSVTDDARFQEAKSLAYWTYQNYHWPSRLAAANE